MTQYHLLIDGKPTESTANDPVLNPATGETIGTAPRATPELVEAAVNAAKRAFPAWAVDAALRSASLRKAAEILRANAPDIGALIVEETGKPAGFAHFEAIVAAHTLEHYSSFSLEDSILLESPQKSVRITREPLGVVAAIAPWNVPVLLLFNKLAPALAAGNTVVAKPSEHTPLATLRIGELLKDAFPPGVLNVIAGDGVVGSELSQHPGVAKITFTGSVATGEKILAYAASGVKRVTLELGGNDPAIVLPGADPDKIAEDIFWAAFRNSGQICFAIKRLYVHESLFEALVEKLAERARRTLIGPGSDPACELGPLINERQRARLSQLVEDARSAGARIHAGGGIVEGPGYFYQPTIVTGVTADAPLVTQEQFGPALPVIAYSDLEDAIAQANDTKFGLGASVWGPDVEAASAVVRRLNAGLAWVNSHADIHPGTPIGGHKSSGLGVEGGEAGYAAYVNLKVINAIQGGQGATP